MESAHTKETRTSRNSSEPELTFVTPVHPSSQVKEIAYHSESHTMAVRFPGPTLYHYQNAPEARFEELRTAASPGKALAAIFKSAPDTYPCHRVVGPCSCFDEAERTPEDERADDEHPLDRAEREDREAEAFGLEGLGSYES